MSRDTTLETSVGYDQSGTKVEWQLCLPGGGDTIVTFPDYLASSDQEYWANRIASALAFYDEEFEE